jgi:hypothetical protein
MQIPSWAAPIVRGALAVLGIAVGVRMLADGFSGIVLTISYGILIAELVGAGLSKSQAQELEAEIQQLLAQKGSPSPAPPTPPAPPSP